MPNASSTGADANEGAARNRQHNQGNQDRKYTPEQKQAVLRIRACKPTAFYEILEVQKTCTDGEIKKAYRKQSLLTHPDKNGHEFADEAFKMVARAFSILGDKDKREKFDRFGTDPDSRFESAQAQNPFAGFANRGAARAGGGGGGGVWEEDISPEEMFARFFGGGGFNAGPFGGGKLDSVLPTVCGMADSLRQVSTQDRNLYSTLAADLVSECISLVVRGPGHGHEIRGRKRRRAYSVRSWDFCRSCSSLSSRSCRPSFPESRTPQPRAWSLTNHPGFTRWSGPCRVTVTSTISTRGMCHLTTPLNSRSWISRPRSFWSAS